MLKELKDDHMANVLPKDKILTYHVNWNENGGNNVKTFSWKKYYFLLESSLLLL